LAEKQSRNIDTQIFVKISIESLQNNALIDLIAESLIANAVEGWRLILELPESQIITRIKQAQSFKSAISALGVRVCLTQFGTSVDSFKMLSHFDADLIKIDRSFVEDLDKNPEYQEKIREFVENARSLDKSTVAEFVSDANTVSLLYSAGVDWIQGNFLSPPLTQMNFDFST
jgi:EAL domain-containing protein (putative c-di-GMP-specific phosphodiesterase class I)